MNNFIFYSPTEFVFARTREIQVGAAGKYGARKVMIVYGGGSVLRSGFVGQSETILQRKPVFVICEMGGVQPNPVDTKVYEGIEICRREQADLLLPGRRRFCN